MASIGIADKATLDSVKQDTTDILSRIGSGGTGGSGSAMNLENVQVFIIDFTNDYISMHHGAIDGIRRIATT